jgi:hypothetical protein
MWIYYIDRGTYLNCIKSKQTNLEWTLIGAKTPLFFFKANQNQAKPDKAKQSETKPSHAKPSQAKPSQAKQSRAKPNKTKQSQEFQCFFISSYVRLPLTYFYQTLRKPVVLRPFVRSVEVRPPSETATELIAPQVQPT